MTKGTIDLRRLKRILSSNSAYAVLDATGAKGGTWLQGGCALLSLCLTQCNPGYEIFDVLDRDECLHHLVIRIREDLFWDAEGFSTRAALCKRWEQLTPPLRLQPHNPDLLRHSEIPHAPEDVARLKSFLEKCSQQKNELSGING